MYSVTIIYVSEPFISVHDNLNRQELLEDYKEWLEDNLNVYSSFFFEEKGTNNLRIEETDFLSVSFCISWQQIMKFGLLMYVS